MIAIVPNWHPVFVYFTVALLITATAIHLLTRFMPNSDLASQLAIAARWNLRIGVAATLFTVAAGWYAYYTVGHDTPSHIALAEHRNWAMATLAVFLGIAAWECYLSRLSKNEGWLFTYGLGVMSLPQAEGHSHEHGGMQSEGAPHAHGHDDTAAHDEHSHGETSPASGAGVAPKRAGHANPPGTPAHRD